MFIIVFIIVFICLISLRLHNHLGELPHQAGGLETGQRYENFSKKCSSNMDTYSASVFFVGAIAIIIAFREVGALLRTRNLSCQISISSLIGHFNNAIQYARAQGFDAGVQAKWGQNHDID